MSHEFGCGTSSPGERWSWEETEARLTPPAIDGLLWSDLHQRMSGNMTEARVLERS